MTEKPRTFDDIQWFKHPLAWTEKDNALIERLIGVYKPHKQYAKTLVDLIDNVQRVAFWPVILVQLSFENNYKQICTIRL